jgi:hypothetical protein
MSSVCIGGSEKTSNATTEHVPSIQQSLLKIFVLIMYLLYVLLAGDPVMQPLLTRNIGSKFEVCFTTRSAILTILCK